MKTTKNHLSLPKTLYSSLTSVPIPEERHHEAGKLVDDLQEEMLRMAKELGRLMEEN